MSQLLDQLRSAGIVPQADLEAAIRRQQIYGGSLDTVLLELELVEPPVLDAQLAAANDCPSVPVGLLEPGLARPWDALPKQLLDLGWAMPLRRHLGQVHVAIHPEIPSEQREALRRGIEGVELFVTCEACLAKLAAERRASVMPQRYAVLALKWVQALKRALPPAEPATPAAPWMTAASDTAPYTVPPPDSAAAPVSPSPPPSPEPEPPAPAPHPVTPPPVDRPAPASPASEPAASEPKPPPREDSPVPQPVKRASTYLYGLPVEDDDDAPFEPEPDEPEPDEPEPDEPEPQPQPAPEEDAIVVPRPPTNRGVEARPSASLGERLAGPRSALEEATERDQATEALARAAMVLSPRVALFGIKREGLRGLESPGQITEAIDQLVELTNKIEAAIEGDQVFDRVTDLDLRIAVGQEMAVPCMFLPVKVHGRPVLMLYIDRNGEPFTDEERAAGDDLCTLAGTTLEGVLDRMRRGDIPKPAPHPASAPASTGSVFTAGSSLLPPGAIPKPPPPAVKAPIPAPTPVPRVSVPSPPPSTLPPAKTSAPPVRIKPPPAPSSAPSSAPSFAPPGARPSSIPPVLPNSAPSSAPSPAAPPAKPPVRLKPPKPPVKPGMTALSSPLGSNPSRVQIELDEEDRAKPEPSRKDIDENIKAAMRGESAAVAKLRGLGEPAMKRVAKQFPGELDVQRRDLDTLPPLPAHGPLIRLVLDLGPIFAPSLAELAEHANPTIRFYVAFVFMELRDPIAVSTLGRLAFDPDADVRAIAMRVLETYSGEPGFEESVGIIRDELGSPNRTRQLHSTRAVGTVRDISAVPLLIELLASKERYIQEASLESLCSITGQQLGLKPHRWRTWYEANAHHHRVEWIISSLAHKDLSVRRWAADELRRITGQRINFLAAGSKQEREIGIRKWVEWWGQVGRAEFGVD